MENVRTKIPDTVTHILANLLHAGFEAHIVGGSVRDIALGKTPKDWDIATNARPEEIQTLFPESFYENVFGTVSVKADSLSTHTGRSMATSALPKETPASLEERPREQSGDRIIEITTYRSESGYEDKRHPSTVSFVSTMEEDLARRDFTMNAMALRPFPTQLSVPHKGNGIEREADSQAPAPISHYETVDPFGGAADIEHKMIRAVGNPTARFGEDALRMLRAIRFCAELRTSAPLPREAFMKADGSSDLLHASSDWQIDSDTFEAIRAHAADIRTVSRERVSDELGKILLSPNPAAGIDLLRTAGLLAYIMPELEEGVGVSQNLHHVYTVYEHNLRALATCPSDRMDVRLAALLHDVGKPRSKRGEGYRSTFYHHDHIGARMTRSLLSRLRFPTKIVEHATLLVDNHLFYYNVGEVTAASVRRLIARVGLENIGDLMHIRIADRLGSGTPKAKPYKLRHLEYMIDTVSHDPVSVKMLAVNGSDLLETLHIPPGPKIGAILDVLLSEVIEDPARNTKEMLLDRARTLKGEDVEHLRKQAKSAIETKRDSDDQKRKRRHWVE